MLGRVYCYLLIVYCCHKHFVMFSLSFMKAFSAPVPSHENVSLGRDIHKLISLVI